MIGRPAVRRLGLIAGIAIVAMAALLASRGLMAQQTGDVSQQMQLFNSLPADQQQSLMQKFGSGGSGTGMGASSSGLNGSNVMGATGVGSQAALMQQMLLQQQRLQKESEEDEQNLGRPVIKPGDTVLLDIMLPSDQAAGAGGQMIGPGGQNPFQNQSANNLPAGLAAGSVNGMPLNAAQLAQYGGQYGSQYGTAGGASAPQRYQEGPQLSEEALEANEKKQLQDTIALIRDHNPYQIDSNGQLLLSGVPPIALAGLTEDLASRRVAAEPAFQKLLVRLTRLPLKKSGQAALKPFGYDLFDNSLAGLLPMLDAPISPDYPVGPGDVLQIQLFGNQNLTMRLTVSRDGTVSLPQLGPIEVGGRRFSAVKSEIEDRVSQQMIGVRADVSMNDTRGINVFVLGEAKYPGSYTVNGLSTVTTALFAAGGVKELGSLRNIQVRRGGEPARAFDLYDLLMRGDSISDVKLLPGDVVFIPPRGPTAAIDGEVQRPAIYELRGMESVSELIRMGGGLKWDADRASAALTRIDDQQRRIVVHINPSAPGVADQPLRDGDELRVLHLRPQVDSGVQLQGYVYRPSYLAWHEGLRLTDVIGSLDELQPGADQHYLMVRHELPDHHVTVTSADLEAALRAPGSAADIPLMARDTITVFDLQSSRENVIRPLMQELRLQSTLSQPTEIVHIDGRVKAPGDYPLEPGMRVLDLIRAGGSLEPSAYVGRAELSRYTVENGDQRQTQVLSVDLGAVRSGDLTANFVLQPFDRLSIKEVSGWAELSQISLKGEVRFPGIYAIKPGETLNSVIARAGGLTQYAFSEGSVFTREELKVREQEQLDRLSERLRMDIAESSMEAARGSQGNPTEAISIGQTLLSQLKSTKAVGRLVINLPAILASRPGSPADVVLHNGDELIVPKQRQDVMVLGEVQDPTSHLFVRRMTQDDYIDQSGGLTRQADHGHIYVVRADGSVATGRRGWFSASGGADIRAGDAIVVPLNTEKIPPLPLWQATTTILYNLAIAAASIRTF